MNKAPFGVLQRDARVLFATITAGVVTAVDPLVSAGYAGTILSAGAQVVSRSVLLDLIDIYSAQFISTGTVAGTWTPQVANDDDPGGVYGSPRVGRYTAFNDLVVPAAVSGGTNFMGRVWLAPERNVNFLFTPSGGTGTVEIWMFGKGLG